MLAAEPTSKVFAGATDVIPQLRSGRPEPGALVDLKKIERLVSVAAGSSHWTIGAATPTVRLTDDDEFTAEFPGQILLQSLGELHRDAPHAPHDVHAVPGCPQHVVRRR